ncbi:ATP-binding cassette domain-containing protein [Mycoplasma sp. NEAQ87857]|uniref:ABC transporter ATP-binding protein n=1 Tax=Mycoplasma sp. NEAQ87857 TaxID=2683967 RepID=UPI0013161DAA|nr:ABC transporter ATP-binding protein [Mycoplasma sp. NEAQ87857]QGZ97952.1 ATP-binding cassette domain-containing protein [Mycoplasma sp. NEAQ87857]
MIQMFKILPRKIKLFFMLGIFFTLINIAVTMILPVLLSQFITLLINEQPTKEIVIFKWKIIGEYKYLLKLLIGSVVGLILLGGITSISSILIIIWAGENASNHYRNTLFKKYQLLSLKDIATFKEESLLTRINDDVAIFWEFLISASTALIKAPLFICFGLIFAFLTDVQFSYAIIAIVPVLVGVLAFIFIKVTPLIQKNRKNLDNITKEVTETINGAKFIKAYNLQEKQFNKFDTTNKTWVNTESKIFKIFSIGTPAFFVIVNLIVVLIFIMAAKIIGDGNANGQLLAKINVFIEYEFIIALGIITFAQFLSSFFRAKISAKRITDVLNVKYDNLYVPNGYRIVSKGNKVNDVRNYGIEFKNVNFKYFETSEDYAVKNINFSVEGGQTLGIIGPTGSGKSTLANLLVNNMKYTEGNILINNNEVKDINTHDLHSKVGIVYQESLLYSGTILSNVTFSKPNANEKEVEKALNNACAYDFIKTFPDRLDHKVAQRGKSLSGGQKQRLSIARTLLIDPKILILDDSTSALDNITTKKLINNINNNYDCTTVIISQKVNSIKHANKILVMDKGEIVAQGTHEELLKTCEWYRSINQNQLEQ